MKGITPILAVIMLLIITVSMVGFAFVWFNSVWENVANSTKTAADKRTIIVNQKIDIETAKDQEIVVRNVGNFDISYKELSVYIADDYKDTGLESIDPGDDCDWNQESIPPNQIMYVNCACSTGSKVKIVAPGNTDLIVCE